MGLPGSGVRRCGSPLGADGEGGPMWVEEPPLAVGFDGAVRDREGRQITSRFGVGSGAMC